MMDVRIYTTPTCGYCYQVKNFLDELGVKYTEYDVSRDRSAAQEMVNFTGQMGVPVISINGQVVIGFDRPRLQQLLAEGNGRKPRLGLKIADADNVVRKPGEPPVFGAVVGTVWASSPAADAGIKPGDIITSINHRRINNVAELEQVIGTFTTGNRVPVTIYRGEQAINTQIIL